MVSFFGFYATMLVPPAFIMLLLLTIPLPHFLDIRLRPIIVDLCQFIFLKPIFFLYGRSIFEVVFVTSLTALASTYYGWRSASSRYMEANNQRTLMMKWRSERNFWICFLGTVLYWCNYRLCQLQDRLEALEKKSNKSQKKD